MVRNLVSVVIPTFNRAQKLLNCLVNVLKQDYELIELIVIDNNSTDNTFNIIKKSFPNIIHVKNQKNLGAAYAKNQGVKIAKGEYVWFLDSDSLPNDHQCLSSMVNIIKNDSSIGSIGGELYLYEDNKELLPIKSLSKIGKIKTKYYEPQNVKLNECAYNATCNCFTRREDIILAGGFDPVYFYLSEDTELGFKLQAAGKRNICDYRTAVIHDIDFSSPRNVFLRVRNPIRLIIKNYPFFSILVLPIYLLGMVGGTSILDRIKNGDPIVRKYFPDKKPTLFKTFAFFIKLVIAFSYGVFWNLIFLPQTLLLRLNKKNHIDEVN